MRVSCPAFKECFNRIVPTPVQTKLSKIQTTISQTSERVLGLVQAVRTAINQSKLTTEKARTLLANYLEKSHPEIQESDIEWVSENPHTYSNSSLGLEEEGCMYLQALVEGTEIQFKYGDRLYTVDTNGQRFVLRNTAVLNR